MAGQQPAYRAFTVIKREGQDDYWLNLGLAFPHKDGKGFNIILQAFPFDAKIVIREITGDDKNAEDERTRQAVRQTNDRRRGRLFYLDGRGVRRRQSSVVWTPGLRESPPGTGSLMRQQLAPRIDAHSLGVPSPPEYCRHDPFGS
jgi:hypothetical protein